MPDEITVEVEVYMSLKLYLEERYRGGNIKLRIFKGSTVQDIRGKLGLPSEDIIAIVNGKVVGWGEEVREGDSIAFMPMLAGG